MRFSIAFVAVVFVVGAPLIQAQTSTADGVDAFIRGDYQRAVEILKPIAEAPGSRDDVASFFMAMLYQSAIGVPGDIVRACALYNQHPEGQGVFARQATELGYAIRGSMRAEELRDCEFVQSEGFNPTFQPATFMLEPDNWISLDLRAATVTYQGTEKRFDLGIASPGVVFFPVEHTELTTGGPQSTRRHFIEFVMWVPTANMKTWTLRWRVHEVVRNDWVFVAAADLTTISAANPPESPSVDVHAMARVRVNEAGDVEWAVLTGPKQQSRRIESDAERQERSQQRRAAEAADARVDWKRMADAKRTPALTYSGGDGCGNVFLYGWSEDRTEAIAVRADRNRLRLSTTPRTFDVALQTTDLEVIVHVFERPQRSWPFCTDVGGLKVVEMWRAASGTVTIELSPSGVRAGAPWSYRATVHIVGAEFVNAAGSRVRQTQPMTLTAIVGFSQR